MITYEWKCKSLECYPEKGGLENVAFKAHWKVIGTSDELNEENENIVWSRKGETELNSVIDAENFTSFEDITNEQAVGWIKSAMGESRFAKIEANIAESIETLKTPPTETINLKLN
jgi:hypothetical protein